MMKAKILIGILAFLMVVNVATIGSFVYLRYKQERKIEESRRDGSRGRPGRTSFVGERRRMMRLPPEHRKQMRNLLGEFQTETVQLRSRVHELESETFELMQRDPVPVGQVDSLLEEISVIHLSISKAATQKMIEAKSFLSPEQQEMFFKALVGSPPEKPGGRMFHKGSHEGGRDKPRGHRSGSD